MELGEGVMKVRTILDYFMMLGHHEQGYMTRHFLRSLVLSTWVYSTLFWLYILVRIIVNGVDVHWPFVDSIQFISISAIGAFAFGLSFLSMFLYLALWGKSGWNNKTP